MALDKEIFPPSEATEVAQAGFDYVNGILPFSTMFPIQSNDGEWTVSWTPNLPTLSTNAMQRRALDARSATLRWSNSPPNSIRAFCPCPAWTHHRT